jgi:uncharacterized protein YuzE
MQITRHSSSQILNAIKIGDQIEDNLGNQGKVIDIEILTKKVGIQYYFRLYKQKTILIIK